MKCPTCDSHKIVKGGLLDHGPDGRCVTRFFPEQLRFFTSRKSVAVTHKAFMACTACGHIWGQVIPSELIQLLAQSGTGDFRKEFFDTVLRPSGSFYQ